MSKFWRFCDFLHLFKVQKKENVALLHGSSTLKWAQTHLCRPSGYGDYRLLVPYNRVLRYRSVQPSLHQPRGVDISQPTSIMSRVLLRCVLQAYPFPLHISRQILHKKSIRQLPKKKINTLDHNPTPYPPLYALRLAQLSALGHV